MGQLPTYPQTVAFHGHSCPGLAMGYRVAVSALRALGTRNRAEDEEFVALAENASCAVDAIQFVTGCTLGKGNLALLDRGKHAYTFWNRETGRGIRFYLEPFFFSDEDRKATMTRAERIEYLLHAPEDEILWKSTPREPLPPEARVLPSRRCAVCGELAMESRIIEQGAGPTPICLACVCSG